MLPSVTQGVGAEGGSRWSRGNAAPVWGAVRLWARCVWTCGKVKSGFPMCHCYRSLIQTLALEPHDLVGSLDKPPPAEPLALEIPPPWLGLYLGGGGTGDVLGGCAILSSFHSPCGGLCEGGRMPSSTPTGALPVYSRWAHSYLQASDT